MKAKRLLAGVLSTAMLLSTVSFTAFADDTDITYPTGSTVAVKGLTSTDDYQFFDTLAEALAAIQNDSADKDLYEIECKADENVGSMTHSSVADNITINGNGAYVSGGGEYDMGFEYIGADPSNPACEQFTENVTVTVNKLHGIAAWGDRHTQHTLNLVFNDCEHMNRVYINGANGTNNITLKNCTFDSTQGSHENTSVYSNAPGEIKIEDCTFNSVSIPVNLNNKSKGAQTVTVKDCTFTDCSTEALMAATSSSGYAAPIRLVTSKENASTTATVDNCTISGNESANGDILIGDGRSGQASKFNVSLTVKNTNAEVKLQDPNRETQTVNVTGGDIKEINSCEYFAVAEVNGTKFTDLKSAIDAAANGDTITLVNDITAVKSDFRYSTAPGTNHDYYTLGTLKNKNITLDLNGKNISIANGTIFDDTTPDGYGTIVRIFRLNEGAGLTITGNGSILCNASGNISAGYAFSLKDTTYDVNLTIENGIIAGYAEVIYCTGTGDHVLINGGTFKSYSNTDKSYILNAGQNGTRNCFTVQGGTFEYIDPRYMNDGNLVKDGYLVTKKGNEYTVIPKENIEATITTAGGRVYSYTVFADAVANASDGDTIKLLTDASGDGIEIAENRFTADGITIDLDGHTYTVTGNLVGSPGSKSNAFWFDAGNKITIKGGTLTSSETATWVSSDTNTYKTAILVQNYTDSLILENVTLDGKNLRDEINSYTLSNNKGNVSLNSSKIFANTDGTDAFAFDLYGTVTVTVGTESTTDGYVKIWSSTGITENTFLKISSNSYNEAGIYARLNDKFVKVDKADIDSRSIKVTTDKTTMKAGEEVKVTVKLKGENLAYASYKLTYDKDLFELKNENGDIADNNGTISFSKHSGTNANGEAVSFDCSSEEGFTLAEYTFTARAQSREVTGDFTLDTTIAHTYDEAQIGLSDIAVSNNDKTSVKITLGKYTAAVKVDQVTVSEAEAAAAVKEIPYDGKAHTVLIDVNPKDYQTINYTYKKNGEATTAPFKEIGDYTIDYEVVSNGYDTLTGSFTLKITAPTAYYVEVNTAAVTSAETKANDYVAGKKLVLVYTDLDGVSFKYNNYDMINVSKTYNEYEYNRLNGSDQAVTKTNFKYVYAYVADAIENGTLADYNALITPFVVESGYTVPSLNKYDEDINGNGTLDSADTTVEYGVWGVYGNYFTYTSNDISISKQLSILKADVNGDKTVNGKDVQRVDLAVRNK